MSSSVSGGRDVLFERALGGLPVPLLTALRGSGFGRCSDVAALPVDWEDRERGCLRAPLRRLHPLLLY